MINIKDLFKILKEAGKVDEYQKILDLIDDSLKIRKENDELKKEIEKLKFEIEELSEKKILEDDLKLKDNAYWKKSDGDGPFCTKCFDENGITIRIPTDQLSFLSNCPKCKNSFNLTGKKGGGEILTDSDQDFDKFSVF
ncbi:MAG: hypothetical protein P1P85_00125 [Patescibacteria group bacterium]|nr:hypothetical protein [Patescibacteria group bacterium]